MEEYRLQGARAPWQSNWDPRRDQQGHRSLGPRDARRDSAEGGKEGMRGTRDRRDSESCATSLFQSPSACCRSCLVCHHDATSLRFKSKQITESLYKKKRERESLPSLNPNQRYIVVPTIRNPIIINNLDELVGWDRTILIFHACLLCKRYNWDHKDLLIPSSTLCNLPF